MGSRAGHINLQFRDQDTPIVEIHLEDEMKAGFFKWLWQNCMRSTVVSLVEPGRTIIFSGKHIPQNGYSVTPYGKLFLSVLIMLATPMGSLYRGYKAWEHINIYIYNYIYTHSGIYT